MAWPLWQGGGKRNLEVPGEIRLHQRKADRAQVVGQPNADTCFLARLGVGVLRQRQGCGYGRPREMEAMEAALGRYHSRIEQVHGTTELLDPMRVQREMLAAGATCLGRIWIESGEDSMTEKCWRQRHSMKIVNQSGFTGGWLV